MLCLLIHLVLTDENDENFVSQLSEEIEAHRTLRNNVLKYQHVFGLAVVNEVC